MKHGTQVCSLTGPSQRRTAAGTGDSPSPEFGITIPTEQRLQSKVLEQFDAEGRRYVVVITSTAKGAHALARLTLNGWDSEDLTAGTDSGLTLVWHDGRLHLDRQWQSDVVEESELDLPTTIQRVRQWVCCFSYYMSTGIFPAIAEWAEPRRNTVGGQP